MLFNQANKSVRTTFKMSMLKMYIFKPLVMDRTGAVTDTLDSIKNHLKGYNSKL